MKLLEESQPFSRPKSNAESSGTAPSHHQTNTSANPNQKGRVDHEKLLSDDNSPSSDLSEPNDFSHGRSSSPRTKLRHLAGKTKRMTKKVFSTTERHDRQQDLVQDDDPATKVLEDDAAFNLKQLNTKHQSDKGLATKAKVNFQAIAAGLANPREAVKGKAVRSTAGRLSRMERPYLSKEMDHELLEAHDNLSRMQSSASSRTSSGNDADLSDDECKERVEQLEARRESLRVAYTTSQFVRRVRVVPKRHADYPRQGDFVAKGVAQDGAINEWLIWIGHVLVWYTQDFAGQYIDDFDQLPFDVDSLRMHLQRLVMASGPWQTFFMDVRSVYRWEDPKNTAKWLSVYIILWYNQYVVSFLYGYILFIVIRNRFYPSSVDAIRESMHRSHDQRSKAYRFGELVDKHGRNHWLEPLLDELGPSIQVQTNDLANMLEVFSNFHGWVYPRKTAATLFFLAVCLMYLRRHAQITREKLIKRAVEHIYQQETYHRVTLPGTNLVQAVPGITLDDSSSIDDEGWHSASSETNILGGSDIAAYRAFSRGVVGKLIVYADGIRFVRSIKQKELWRRSFLELAEMRKRESSSLSKLPMVSPQTLEFKFIDGSKTALEGMKESDSAFNTILGLSGLQWQSLQTKTVHEDA
ncbi:MAG: hypothetical protein Q9212_000858 [Teloschistes hypoglaucus]